MSDIDFGGIKFVMNPHVPEGTMVCGPDLYLLATDPEAWKRKHDDDIGKMVALVKNIAPQE